MVMTAQRMKELIQSQEVRDCVNRMVEHINHREGEGQRIFQEALVIPEKISASLAQRRSVLSN